MLTLVSPAKAGRPSQELRVATSSAVGTTRGLTKVRECERSQPLVPRVFTTTRYSRSELRRPCCFCQVEFPASELRQHAKECGRSWLRRKNAVDRRRQSAQRFPCGNQHVQNRGCQPSQAQNNVAVQAAPSQLEVARTSTRQQQSEDGALALCVLRCRHYTGDSLAKGATPAGQRASPLHHSVLSTRRSCVEGGLSSRQLCSGPSCRPL